MNFDDSGKRVLDRRVQYCQFRIQQALSLIDDEIERLLKRYRIYNSQIIECKEKIQDLENQIKSAEISQDGFYRMRTADLKTYISRLKARQFQQISEIKQNYALEVESMQRDFETILRNFNHSSNGLSTNDLNLYKQKEKAILNDIEIYKSKIQTYREALQQQEKEFNSFSNVNETDVFYEEINSPIILELSKTIEERSKERYQSLIDSKNKLRECVEQIESMDRQHKLKINELADQISSIEGEYHKLFSQLSEKHEIKMMNLKKHLLEAEKREKVLAKAAHKLESENQRQLKNTKIELQKMEELNIKSTSKSLKNSLDDSQGSNNYYNQLKDLKSDIKRLLKKLHIREEELKEKREENQALKREIGSLKHNIRFSGRMVGSMYPYHL